MAVRVMNTSIAASMNVRRGGIGTKRLRMAFHFNLFFGPEN
jgi:hypothetical protein